MSDYIRKLKRLVIPKQSIADMFRGHHAYRFVSDDLPDDVMIWHMFYDAQSDHLYAVLHSDEFEEVPEGAILPLANYEIQLESWENREVNYDAKD